MKIDFEAAALSAINKVFPDSVITGCDFYLNRYLWIKNIGLTVEYKENEQVRIIYRIYTALLYLSVNKIEELGL